MAVFEITATHQMFLGAGSQINKGERLTMNIHTMGVRPSNIFSNPETRRQAIQQFSVNGIDVRSRDYLLNTGHWNIKRVPDGFSKSLHNYTLQDTEVAYKDLPNKNGIIDDVEMKKECINMVKIFYNEGLELDYADRGLKGRCEIASNFYDGVKINMGIDAELCFEPKPTHQLGGYNPSTNRIELNSKYLENADCEDLLNTILHESRHAFQNKCIQNPDSVTVKNNVIDVWKDNFDNYISPQFDFEAYENQEIEKDANYFADSVMKKGTEMYYA